MQPIKYILFIVGLLFFSILPSSAAVNTWRQLTTDDGLLSDHIHSVLMDNDGVLWFGTRYGMVSYDGNTIVPHLPLSAHTSPKIYNDIPAMVPIGDDRIYFITSLVFGVYDKSRDSFTPIVLDDSETYTALCRINQDEILIGSNKKLTVYNTSTGEYHDMSSENDTTVSGISSIYQDRIGQIWVGTNREGLFRYSPHERKLYHAGTLNNIECIYQASNDKIYVGTRNSGLYLINNPYTLSSCHPARVAKDVITDHTPVFSVVESVSDGQLWIGTDGGIIAIDIYSHSKERMRQELSTGRVTMLWADDSGMIWATTSGSGIYFIDTSPALFDSVRNGRPDLPSGWSNTLAIYEDSRGMLWTVCLIHPLVYNKPGESEWRSPYKDFGIERSSMPDVLSIGEDLSGNMYFGTFGSGLIRLNVNTGALTQYTPANSNALPDSHVMRIKTDSKGNMWLGTISGFGVIGANGQQCIMATHGDVMGICESNGKIYVATLNDGIYSVDINSLASAEHAIENSRMTADDGFQPVILSIASSSRHNLLYVGTEDEGLWTFDTKTGKYHLTDYVPRHCNLQVSYIHEDSRGYVWIATNQGLYRINGDNVSERKLYTIHDGLDNDYFTYNSVATDSLLYLLTPKGVEIIDIESTYNNACLKVPVKFGFSEIFFNNRRFKELLPEARERISGDRLPFYNRRMTVPQDLNNFSIEFAAYEYRNPDLVQFSYMLEGYDKDWQPPLGNNLSATYTNLPPGDYKFRLRAIRGDGNRGDEEKVIDIRILPPWYLTKSAICIYILLIILFIYLWGLIVRRREQEKSRLLLLRQEKESFEELNRTKLRFFTNVTHELLTPLTVISASISELRAGKGDMSSLYRIAEVNVAKLVRLLQQILEFRKVETDNIKLRVSYGDIGAFVNSTVEALRPLTLKQSMKLELKLPDERLTGYFDPDKLDKILYNLVSNATKYSGSDGTITISAGTPDNGRSVVIKISDTGQGIPKSKLTNLFKRFYDGDYREHNTTGTGIGLSLTKDLVELSHGTIEVDSEEGKGTCFTVTLPLTAESFHEEEMSTSLITEKTDEITTYIEDTAMSPDNTGEGKGRKKILIIEDNEDLLVLMKRVIGRTHEVITESNGQAGLETALRDIPDLIITDLTMPGIDGLEIIRRLRKDDRTSRIPIIVLTARRQDEDSKDSYNAGADVYLPKPFDISVLNSCITTQLNSHQRYDDNGRLVIDLKKYDYEPADMQLLKQATEVVERNLDKSEFDIPTFAKEMGMSQTHLFRKLKELTDMSPTHFIRATRLHVAARILTEHPDIRIGELAFMVGFSDARYFGNCFKKEFGVTPGEYKAKN